MDYEYYYNNACNRYYDACSEINNCQNRLQYLNARRQDTIQQINELKIEIEKERMAQEGMEQIIKGDGSLQQRISGVSDKTSLAAANYIGMASASDVISKDLTVVYGDEFSKTKGTLNSILNTLKTKNMALGNKLSSSQSQLTRANAELQDINSGIRSTESNLQSWEIARRNAANDMEYYRRKMQKAG